MNKKNLTDDDLVWLFRHGSISGSADVKEPIRTFQILQHRELIKVTGEDLELAREYAVDNLQKQLIPTMLGLAKKAGDKRAIIRLNSAKRALKRGEFTDAIAPIYKAELCATLIFLSKPIQCFDVE
jgi:hypothetical protein